MIVIIICILIGTVCALFVPFNIPYEITRYVAVALLAGFDSILGGIVANVNHNFKLNIFVTGFFGNSVIAALITYIGTLLNVDLSMAVAVVFGTRMFQNFAIIRRFLINRYYDRQNSKKIQKITLQN